MYRSISFLAAVILVSLLGLVISGCGGGGGGGTAIKSVSITPPTMTLAAGTVQQYTVTLIYDNGTTEDITAIANITSSDDSCATVMPGGMINAMAPGTVTITGEYETYTGSATLTITGAALESLTVSPAVAGIANGTTQQFAATGVFDDGTTQDLTAQVTWTTSDTAVATIDTGGLATAVGMGEATVTAGLRGREDTAELRVTSSTLVSMAVTPATSSIAYDSTQQFAATGTYDDESTQDLTSIVTWAVTNTAVASIDDAGLVSAVAPGEATVTADYEGFTGSAALTVTPAELVSISVVPSAASIAAGTKQQYTAIGTYDDGTTQDITSTVAWSASGASATIGVNTGQATGVSAGTATITVASGGISGSATLTVTNAYLTGVSVSPGNPNIFVFDSQQFTATGYFSDGGAQDVTSSVTWGSSSPAVASINPATGLASALDFGASTISATDPSTSLSGSTTLTVDGVAIEALYPVNGKNLNDYVRGASIADATDTACAAGSDSACVNGGLVRTFSVTGVASCTGITADDTLGALNWECDGSVTPVRMVSTGPKDGVNISDLIDFNTGSWRTLSATAYSSGTPVLATATGRLWDNPVMVDNDGGYLDSARVFYIVTASTNSDYIINAPSVGLVVKPGAVINGTDAGGTVVLADGSVEARDFLWIEGEVDATGDDKGIYLKTIRFSTLRNVTANGADSGLNRDGVYLESSSNNTLSGVTASNNGNGVFLESSSDNNTLSGVTASNNTDYGVYLESSSNNTLSGVTASNNTDYGVYLESSSNNTLSGVTASNNDIGVSLFSSSNNTLSGVTASNNDNNGVSLYSSSNNTLSGVTASNNFWDGVRLVYSSSNNTLSGVTASNNSQYGVWLYFSSNNYFTGPLKVGNNAPDCVVYDGTNPGLLVRSTCANNGSSDATLTKSVSVTVASSFMGKVDTDDTVNTSDTDGTAAYSSSLDWFNFENPYRAWGKDGSAFPNYDHQGRWSSGTGRIWDWTMQETDTVIVNSLSYPGTGDIANTLTHLWEAADEPACADIGGATWGADVCDLPGYTDQTSCEAAATPAGFGNWTSDKCYTVMLRNAVEIHDDDSGNDNTLCESGEDCLWMRNMGSYQGHGAIIDASPAFTDGAMITGVTLKVYEMNGY